MIAVKEAFVTPGNFEELLSLIEETLLENRKTLVFIENQIYSDLCEKANIGISDDGNCKFHYVGERILIETSSSSITALVSFNNDCGDFKQLVVFRSTKIHYYMRDVDTSIVLRWLLIHYKD